MMNAIEWAPFEVNDGVSEQQVLESAEVVQNQFVEFQKGFVRRFLVKRADGEYADVLWWKTKADAEAISEKAMSSEICLNYFKLMKKNDQAGAGFSHYDILREWRAAE